MQNSSSSKKIAIIAIVAIIVVAGYIVFKKPTTGAVTQTQTATSETATSQTAAVVNAMPTDPAVEQVKTTGASDADLNSNTAALDAQYTGFSADSKDAGAATTTTTVTAKAKAR